MKNALSFGVDSERITSLTGAISMAYYREIPQEIAEFTLLGLPAEFVEIMLQFQERFILN